MGEGEAKIGSGVESAADWSRDNLYRLIPSLHELLQTDGFSGLLASHTRESVLGAARIVLGRLRQEIAEGHHTQQTIAVELEQLAGSVAHQVAWRSYRLRRVINATGVILHTNLGRAPLSASALAHILDTASGYSNLEFDLASGERSRRDDLVEDLLLRLLAEPAPASSRSAIVVNNCAAATFLALNTLAGGGEVIVSRGELVEIGGGFRIPDILAKSGAILREVGTTNRTRLADYEGAISPATRLILRVHQSNFAMQGFVERPALDDLVLVGRRLGIPVFDDQGTGLLQPLDSLGIAAEPSFPASVRAGSSLVAASGDKLFGGPQCGLLLGQADLIAAIRRNPLFRTYRVDKLTYAALEATLVDYLGGDEACLPVQRMLRVEANEIFSRCAAVSQQVSTGQLEAEAVPVESLIGGGTAPTARLQSAAISLRHTDKSPQELLFSLRRLDPPVIGRIHEQCVLLDLRTVEPEFDETLARALCAISADAPGKTVRA